MLAAVQQRSLGSAVTDLCSVPNTFTVSPWVWGQISEGFHMVINWVLDL